MGDSKYEFNRRSFLKGAALVGAGSLVPGSVKAMAQESNLEKKSVGTIPKRLLGKTGIEVSALGLGGYHLGSAKTQKEAMELVARAIDAGITFFDNAWDYHDGQSEEYMGQALKGKRDQVVLMTKCCTHGRSKEVAMRMLEQSLRRLQTDHLDVWQIHEVVYENDPDLIFASGGAAEALLMAKQQGKVRAIGFTGHKHPRIHLKIAVARFSFRHGADAVELPGRNVPQLRTTSVAGVAEARNCAARHEEHGGKRGDCE
jgi:aryl-alcohol dehydrogenase-like predicted oxidoreductase